MYMTIPFFLLYIVYAVMTPYLPLLVRLLGYSPGTVGMLLGVFEGAGIGGPFLFGFFADRQGRYKPSLLITCALTAAAVIPLALLQNPLVSFCCILLLGLGFRSTLPLLEAVTTIAIGGAGNYGKIRTAGSISFILTTLFLQAALILPPDSPGNIALWIILSTGAGALAIALIPGAYESARPGAAPPGRPGGKLWTAALGIGILMMALNRLGLAPVYTFFSLFLTESVGWNAVGGLWALAALAELPCMFLSRGIINRFGALNCMAVSNAFLVLRLLIYALFPSQAGIICAQLLHSFCFGLFHPAAIAFISASVPPERRALGMNLYLSLGSGLPNLLGAVLGGILVEYAGYRALFGGFALFPLAGIALYGVTAYRRGARGAFRPPGGGVAGAEPPRSG
jgi:PPP family 3-phenylpropionic acid transporter